MKSNLLIVTTFYNENERLRFTLDNMLCQTSTDFVHLLIDDGSTETFSDEIVKDYISKSKAKVVYEKHSNVGINEVHMRAFQRTEEFECSHFMWLDCGDGLKEKSVDVINKVITDSPKSWLHLNGYYISDNSTNKIKMSSKSYLPYLKQSDQLIPFCFSISTYGHFIIPYRIYSQLNPNFTLVDGFYYDAQIVGALSINSCPHKFIEKPLSIIQDDQHFSVTNSSGNSYRDNLLKLSEFVVLDTDIREKISKISSGMNLISINKLLRGKYSENRARTKELKNFYKLNGIKITKRYKWVELCLISLFYFC